MHRAFPSQSSIWRVMEPRKRRRHLQILRLASTTICSSYRKAYLISTLRMTWLEIGLLGDCKAWTELPILRHVPYKRLERGQLSYGKDPMRMQLELLVCLGFSH